MKKAAMLLAVCFGGLFAREIYVEKHFIDGTRSFPKVNPGIMKIISMAESSGIPNTVAFLACPEQAEAANQALYRIGVKYRVRPYDSRRYIFSVWPEVRKAKQVFAALTNAGVTSYDIGLVQVNSLNAKRNGWDEARLLTDLSYNVEKGAHILSECMKNHSELERSIECYNKGSRKEYNYKYYQRIFALAKK